MTETQALADSRGGTAAETVTINGVDWAKTSCEAGGTAQTTYPAGGHPGPRAVSWFILG